MVSILVLGKKCSCFGSFIPILDSTFFGRKRTGVLRKYAERWAKPGRYLKFKKIIFDKI